MFRSFFFNQVDQLVLEDLVREKFPKLGLYSVVVDACYYFILVYAITMS